MNYQSHTPASIVHLEKIGQIALTVTDLARARTFYEHTLGMRFLFDASSMVFFQCGDIRFALGTGEPNAPRGGTILYFNVEDLSAVYAHLAAQGVAFVQPPHLVAHMPDHDLWLAFFHDPDQNVIGLMSEVRPPAA
jgi:methylmalonyl-CoA/ethylmalonyl-CoA epimerase